MATMLRCPSPGMPGCGAASRTQPHHQGRGECDAHTGFGKRNRHRSIGDGVLDIRLDSRRRTGEAAGPAKIGIHGRKDPVGDIGKFDQGRAVAAQFPGLGRKDHEKRLAVQELGHNPAQGGLRRIGIVQPKGNIDAADSRTACGMSSTSTSTA